MKKKRGCDAAKSSRPYFVLSTFVCCLLVTALYFGVFPSHSGGGKVFLFSLAAYAVYRIVIKLPPNRVKYALAPIVVGLLSLLMYWGIANIILFKELMYPPLCQEPLDMPPFTVGDTDMHKLLNIEPVPMRCRNLQTGEIQPY